jgi:hypothetical protein
MVGLNPLLLDTEPLNWLLRDADGNVRGALICWGVALGAFIVLRPPRQLVLACLFAATVTVGLAVLVVEAVPVQFATASKPSSPPVRAVPSRAAPNGAWSANRSAVR